MSPARYLKQNLFTRPYPLLPLAVWTFFVLAFLLHPQSAFRLLRLSDADDYMRLNEVINWLKSAHPFGASWFDVSQPRLSPGEHVVVNWARLVDLPIALFALPFIHIFGMQKAVMISGFIVPPLLFGVLLVVLPILARPIIGEDRANLVAVIVLFMPAILFNYSPGRVDHHGYQILIAGISLLCLEKLCFEKNQWKAAIAAAVAIACGFWIGAEALPWAILFAANLALIAALRGGDALRNAGMFGAAFPLATLIIFPIALPPAQYGDLSITWFSLAYVIFAILTGAVFVVGWALGRLAKDWQLRLGLFSALGFCAAALFFYFVPSLFGGPYANFDVITTDLILDHVGEAQPLAHALNLHSAASFFNALPLMLHYLFLPLLGLGVIGWNITRTSKQPRLLWIMHGIFLLSATALTLFWQLRVIYFAELYSLVPATWLVWQSWDWIGAKLKGRPRFWAEFAVFIAIAPLPVVLLPDAVRGATFYPDLLLFPVTGGAGACSLNNVAEYLSATDTYGNRPRVILSGINEGAELLYRTPHFVLSAPYNVHANRDVLDFFDAREDAPARAILKKDKVDLVLVCRHVPYFYAGLGDRQSILHAHFSVDKTGHLEIASSKDHPALIEKLVNGQAPAWLKPVELPGEKDYLLFEVKN
jgi:hypothetical protein